MKNEKYIKQETYTLHIRSIGISWNIAVTLRPYYDINPTLARSSRVVEMRACIIHQLMQQRLKELGHCLLHDGQLWNCFNC